MSTSRAYLSASLAYREGIEIRELDALDREVFVYLEELKNRQEYLKSIAPLVEKREEFHNKLQEAFFPFSESAGTKQAAKMNEALEEMTKHSYSIKRGPFGQTLVVSDDK